MFIVICLNLRSPKFSIDYNVFRFGKTAEFGRLPNFDRLFFGYFTVFYMISDKSVVIKNTFSLHFILFWPLIFILNIQIGISNCLPRICYQKSLGWLVGEKADFGTFGPVFLPKIIFMNFSFTCHVFLTLRSIRHQVCDKKCVRVESAAKISQKSGRSVKKLIFCTSTSILTKNDLYDFFVCIWLAFSQKLNKMT